jgi:hypothetical protein
MIPDFTNPLILVPEIVTSVFVPSRAGPVPLPISSVLFWMRLFPPPWVTSQTSNQDVVLVLQQNQLLSIRLRWGQTT